MKISVFWFRRDLRLEDNKALYEALNAGIPVLPIFIFDRNIISELSKDDPRITFIYRCLERINKKLNTTGASLKVVYGDPYQIWVSLTQKYTIEKVYWNKDYEPYALKRDELVKSVLKKSGVEYTECKDQVIFEMHDIIKNDFSPYSVYTPYRNKWLKTFNTDNIKEFVISDHTGFFKEKNIFPKLSDLGFKESFVKVLDYDLSGIDHYDHNRDEPWKEATTNLGPHLRFGSISIRKVFRLAFQRNQSFVNEIIWREFFMQILFHFPEVVDQNFKRKYDVLVWRNNDEEFKRWCIGETGYPLVDAGMRQLNTTGYMHNRVRMVVAGFLSKYLLVDWRWGEAYFASKLLDYELSSNNGNWQWAAGTGCDAVPYFRIFNPEMQQKKFDKNLIYVNKWIPELNTSKYPKPIIESSYARKRAMNEYQKVFR